MLNYKEFRRFLNRQCCVRNQEKILVGVSGGADSMALLDLLMHCKNEIIVAHCNFQLRGKASDGDEVFVREYCKSKNITLFSTKFNTVAYAQKNSISIEMAARDLRYEWFNWLCAEHSIRWIAVGHHLDDNVETFFINLLRGTGIRGLSGMNPVSGNVIRPLLFTTRTAIVEYCTNISIHYREDDSNNDASIIRNKIRHQVLPLLKSINPSFIATMEENMKLLHESDEFIYSEIQKNKKHLIVEEDGVLLISIKDINQFKSRRVVLYELLKEKGFSSSQIADITHSLDGESGRQFLSKDYRLVRDRYNLVLMERGEFSNGEFYINKDESCINNPFECKIRTFKKNTDFRFSKDQNLIHIDADLVEFPLTIRRWKQGDTFRPLGMINYKKLSDFFIDEKLSVVEKEQVWLLTSNDEIVWVIGHRIDDRFKISTKTHTILELSLK